MQKLAQICIKRPIFASMLILSLVVVGAAAYFKLGVDRLPSVDLPTVFVRTSLPGTSPEDMERLVSYRIENAVSTVEGIEELRSISSQGSSFVIATFKLSRKIDDAAQDVRDRVASVIRELPDDVDPPIVSKRNNDDDPVLTVALSGPRTKRELTELAEQLVKKRLERSSGVGEVQINGGARRALNIWVDPDKLIAFNLPITAVRDAIVAQNSDIPGGNVTGGVREQVLRTMGRLENAGDFNDLVIANRKGQPIRVRDIGFAEDGTKEERNASRLNGVPTVSLEIKRQSGANSVEVIESAKAQLKQVEAELPPDVKLEIIRDQSKYIYAALHEINVHLWAGSALACLVVLAFMRNWRSTIIAAVAIPASVVATFGMMWALNFTLNSVTMLALVLMVGIVIDDAIVVLENIFRFVEEKKMTPRQAAVEGTREIGLAVLATTLSLVVIFIPVSFMSSVSGRFLYQFGITAAVAVMVSLLVSFTLTPMMSSRMLKRTAGADGHDAARSRKGFYGLIDATYTWMLRLSMKLRWGVAVAAIVVMWTAAPLYRHVRQEWIPSDVDEAEFTVNVNAPEGTSITSMNDAMIDIEKEIMEIRGVRLVLSTAGSGFMGGTNGGQMYVRIAPHEERSPSVWRFVKALFKGKPSEAFEGNYSQREVMAEVRQKLRKYRDLRPGVRNLQAFSLGGGNYDIDFVIKGPELLQLNKYAEELREKVRTGAIPGIVDADTTLKLDKPELQSIPDRDRAQALGVSMRDIGQALRLMIGGDTEVSRFRDPTLNEDYDVQLRLAEGTRNDTRAIERLYLTNRDGKLVALSNVAKLVEADSASRIDRLDRQRMVALRGGVGQGYALQDRVDALRKAAAELNMPAGYTTQISGKGKELERTFSEFLWAFLLSIIFMYIILSMNYESLVHPFTILLSLPLTVPFALLSLYMTQSTLNLYSALGILVLFGVVKKNSILQIDHMNHLRETGMPRAQAIIEGNRDRLRPILMTTLALVAGMLPLALGTGPGAEERRAVAIVVIGGQTLSLLLTLLVTPVAYSFFDDIGQLIKGKGPKPPTPPEHKPAEPLVEREVFEEEPEPVGV